MEGNGSYVTRAELAAHIQPMRDDIKEIGDDVKKLLREQGALDAKAEASKDISARVWGRLAFAAAVIGDIATIVWLTH